MLRNKNAFKRLRNVIILGLILIIMLGIYNNTIRNSKAEDRIQLTAEIVDQKQLLSNKTILLDAIKNEVVEGEEATYSIQLTNLVDGKQVSKYYMSDGTEVEAIAGTAYIVKESDIVDGKIQIQLSYDSKEVVSGEQTLVIYNQTLTTSPVTISGYVPERATLNVQTLDITTLADIVLPEQNLIIDKAYDISINYDSLAYEPYIHGETVSVAIAYDSTEAPVVYHVSNDNSVSKIDSVFEGRTIKFTANEFSKYLIANEISNGATNTVDNTISNTVADGENDGITNTVDNTVGNFIDDTKDNTIANTVSNTTIDNTTTDNPVTNTVESPIVEDKEPPVWTKVSSTLTEEGIDIVIQGTDNANWGYDELKDNLIEVWIDGEKTDSISETELEVTVEEQLASVIPDIEAEVDKLEGLTDEEKEQEKEKRIASQKEFIRFNLINNKILIKLQNKEDITEGENEQAVVKGVKYTVSLSNMEQKTKQIKPETLGTEDEEYKKYKEWSGNVSLKIAAGTLTDIYANVSAETIIEDAEKTDRQTEATADKMFIDYIKPEIAYQLTMTNLGTTERSITVVFDVIDKYFNESTLKEENINVVIGGIDNVNETVEKTLTKMKDIEETINGVTKKIGERYQLVIKKLENIKQNEELYWGPIQLVFTEGIISDTSNNLSLAKTITTSITDPNSENIVEASDIKWRIFYNDGNYVYLIPEDYVPVKSMLTAAELTELGITSSIGTDAYWTSPTSLSYTINASSPFMISKASSFTNTYANYKVVASLLATDKWKALVNPYAIDAIGSPTIEMWTSAWNIRNSTTTLKTIYSSKTNARGYYVGTSSTASTYQISGVSGDDLFFPAISNDYWIASPSAYTGGTYLITATTSLNSSSTTPNIYYRKHNTTSIVLRPIIRLNGFTYGISETSNNVTTWTLGGPELASSGGVRMAQTSTQCIGDYVEYDYTLKDTIKPVISINGEPTYSEYEISLPIIAKEDVLFNMAQYFDRINEKIKIYTLNSSGEYEENSGITAACTLGEFTAETISMSYMLTLSRRSNIYL